MYHHRISPNPARFNFQHLGSIPKVSTCPAQYHHRLLGVIWLSFILNTINCFFCAPSPFCCCAALSAPHTHTLSAASGGWCVAAAWWDAFPAHGRNRICWQWPKNFPLTRVAKWAQQLPPRVVCVNRANLYGNMLAPICVTPPMKWAAKVCGTIERIDHRQHGNVQHTLAAAATIPVGQPFCKSGRFYASSVFALSSLNYDELW